MQGNRYTVMIQYAGRVFQLYHQLLCKALLVYICTSQTQHNQLITSCQFPQLAFSLWEIPLLGPTNTLHTLGAVTTVRLDYLSSRSAITDFSR